MAHFLCVKCGAVIITTGAVTKVCSRCERAELAGRADPEAPAHGLFTPHPGDEKFDDKTSPRVGGLPCNIVISSEPDPSEGEERGGTFAAMAVAAVFVAALGILWFAVSINARMTRMEMAAAVAEEETFPPPPLVAKKPAAAKPKAAAALMAQTRRLPPVEANENLRSFLWYGGVIGGVFLLIMSIKTGFLIALLANVILVFLKLLEGVGRAAELAEKVDRQRHAMDHLLGRPHDHCHHRHSDD